MKQTDKRKGSFVSLRKRCNELVLAAKKKFSKMKQDFKDKACVCLGCCDAKKPPEDECWFPMTIQL